ncbi:hypothetical protein LBMAG42_17170 [Deltaproteobacteria bacterium]|nr:hypothetical protein LBMAG42_17170 [Deltaproteobacteria bacterium]
MSPAPATVLVVEDERLVALDLQRSLTRFGYRVPITVASAADAVAVCQGSRPALALVDVHLKGDVDGIELGRRLREEFDVPFIFLTAYADEETVKRAGAVGPGAYLLKPVNVDELRIAIEVAMVRHAAESRLRAQTRWMRGVLDAAGEGIIVVDREGCFEVFNEAAMRILDYSPGPQDKVGQMIDISFFLPDRVTPFEPAELPLARALRGEPSDRMDIYVRSAGVTDGVFVSATGRTLRGDAGEITGAVLTFRDVTALRRTQERLATLATTDGLTGLGNHRAFQERLAAAAAASPAEGPGFSLALLDLDGFKALNDRFGHPAGDAVLARIADVIRRNVRRSDFAARYGGDEFCVLYPDTDEDAAYGFAERLRVAIEALPTLSPLTVSIGVCGYRPRFGHDGAALLQAADEALYEAKQRGKNCVARAAGG